MNASEVEFCGKLAITKVQFSGNGKDRNSKMCRWTPDDGADFHEDAELAEVAGLNCL